MNQDLQNLEIKVENEGTTPQGRVSATEWNILVAAVKSLDLTGGSADAASILQVVANAGYATQEWVTSQNYITSSAFDNLAKNLVTLDTTQAITGMKDFTNGLKIGGLSAYKSQADTIYLDANLVVRGGITAFGTNKTITASIFEALPIDGATLKRTENGVLYVDTTVVGGGGGTGGGISIADVESYLTTNGYATQSWVTGKGYITSSALEPYALKTSIPTNTNQLTNGAGFITGITSSMVTSALGYTPLSTGGDTITATGRRQLSLQSSTDAKAALWLGTGMEQFSKGGFLQYDYSNGSIALVNFSAMANSYSGLAGLFIKRDNRITVGDANLSVEYDVLHSGNFSNYALPLTGGTVYGDILVTGAITMYYSSDERLKKDIRKVNASKVLMSLGGVYQYEYIDSEVQNNHIYEGTHYGLIYQHVKGTKLDKMCYEREDKMGALNYISTDFISIVAGATMENISEVEKLKRKIRYLEQKVKQLENRAA